MVQVKINHVYFTVLSDTTTTCPKESEAARTSLTWLHCDHHPRLKREGTGHVWSVVDIHPKVMANMMRAVFSSSLEKIVTTVLLEQ